MTDASGVSTAWQSPTDDPSPVRHRRSGGLVGDLAVVLGGLLLLGVVCGVVWSLLVDPAEFTKLRGGGVMQEEDLGKRFSADGVYVVIAVVAGLVSGLVLTWWRSRDVLLTSLLLLVGAGLAAVAMALTGHLLGPGDPGAALAAARVGARVPERLGVDAFPVYLAWPIAVLAGALVVLLNVSPSSRSDSSS
jgi:hypothetical protein